MLVTGFHGTTNSALQSINSQGFLIERRNKRPKWLGRGVYFFQDGAAYARKWARMLSDIRKETPYILEARINLGNCIDFLDGSKWDLFGEVINKMPPPAQTQIGPEALFRTRSPAEEENIYKNWEDDYYITELYRVISADGKVDTIRCAFFEGQPLHKNSWFIDEAHVQICVKDPAAITPVSWSEVKPDEPVTQR